MALYPIFLDLTGRTVLVVGAGAVGLRKVHTLREAGAAEILVLDIGVSPVPSGLAPLAANTWPEGLPQHDPHIRFERRTVTKADMAGRALVFAATSDRTENARIASLAATAGIFCNVADNSGASDFHVPAQAVTGDIRVAVTTGGHSPALARRIRMELEETVLKRYAPLAALMGRLRPLVLAKGQETAENTAFFRSLVESTLAVALAERDKDAARACLRGSLPESLHGHIEELLHGLC